MKISLQLLDKFFALRNAYRTGSISLDTKKQRAALIWDEVHAFYGLSDHPKLKVELDGESAGELRVKSTGEVYEPPSIYVAVNDMVPGAQNTAPPARRNIDQNRMIIIDHAGVAHICENISQLINFIGGDSLDEYLYYCVAA